MKILLEKCKKCLACIDICPVCAISKKDEVVTIDKNICLGCGCCAATCPSDAITYD